MYAQEIFLSTQCKGSDVWLSEQLDLNGCLIPPNIRICILAQH